MKGIDPKWTMYLGLLVTIEQAIGHGSVSLTNLVPAEWAPYITSWCNFLAFVGTSIMTYQAAVSSPTAGPAINTPIAPAAKPVIILAVLLGGMFAFAGDASAQIKVKMPIDLTKLNQPAAVPTPAPRAATGDPLTKFINDLEAIKQEVVEGIVADFNAADADAGQLVNASDATSFKDPISHACYPAAVKFLQSLPVATPTTGRFILVQLFQKKRDFVAQIRAGLPVYLKLGCAPLIGDEAMIFAKLMGLIGVKVGLDALVPGLGFALPTL